MKIFYYDGSFLAFLAGAHRFFTFYGDRDLEFRVVKKRTPQEASPSEAGQQELLFQDTSEEENWVRDLSYGAEIEARLSSYDREFVDTLFFAWMARREDSTSLARLLVRALGALKQEKALVTIYSNSEDPLSTDFWEAARQAQREFHALAGMLRFTPARDGTLVSRCAPQTYVLPALATHFCTRFWNHPWAILDVGRNELVASTDGTHFQFASYDPREGEPYVVEPGIQPEEYEALWRGYFKAISITSRENVKLQKKLVPLKYRPYMTEFVETNEHRGMPFFSHIDALRLFLKKGSARKN
ncbi:MAG: TIGR03915 family putative DNA repair protein [Treponemataceae bacterium]|nr:TIGR03915 family putative DNA repair protein [Treponemataceae bacterium]